MFKETFILQEELVFDNYSVSTGYINEMVTIAQERYNEILSLHQKIDDKPISINMSSKVGFTNVSLDRAIIFHNKLETNVIQKKYPNIKFSNISNNVDKIWDGESYRRIRKVFKYTVTGERLDLAEYFYLENNQSKESFLSEYPTNVEEAKKQISKKIFISCKKDKVDYLRYYINSAGNNYVTIISTINEETSKTEQSLGVKLFKQQCLFDVTISGHQFEVDLLLEVLQSQQNFTVS